MDSLEEFRYKQGVSDCLLGIAPQGLDKAYLDGYGFQYGKGEKDDANCTRRTCAYSAKPRC